jgi:hypothetical protein
VVVGFIIRALKGVTLPMCMFHVISKKIKVICVFVELTHLYAAGWIDHYLHYSPHIKLPWFILVHLIVRSVVVVVAVAVAVAVAV